MAYTLPFDVRQLDGRDMDHLADWELACEKRAPKLAHFLRVLLVREDGRRSMPHSDLIEPAVPVLDIESWTLEDVATALGAAYCEVYATKSPPVGRLADALLRDLVAHCMNLLEQYAQITHNEFGPTVKSCTLQNSQKLKNRE